jgi:hypothetical protein
MPCPPTSLTLNFCSAANCRRNATCHDSNDMSSGFRARVTRAGRGLDLALVLRLFLEVLPNCSFMIMLSAHLRLRCDAWLAY